VLCLSIYVVNRGAERYFWDGRYSVWHSGAVGCCGRDRGRGYGAVQIGTISWKGKIQFFLYFFNRLNGICSILLNPKSLFTKRTKKSCCLSSLLSYAPHNSSLFFISQPSSPLNLHIQLYLELSQKEKLW
jgi:hypothetical protein